MGKKLIKNREETPVPKTPLIMWWARGKLLGFQHKGYGCENAWLGLFLLPYDHK
jgi:hypothetical protein